MKKSNSPKYVVIDNEKYLVNTDFRYALKCDWIYKNDSIGEYEKILAIIFTLFGKKGLKNYAHHEKLLNFAYYFLASGKEIKDNNEEPNMDLNQDLDYIEASFTSDFGIDLENTEMHLWKFSKLMNGLTSNCVLNNVRYIRDYDLSQIKDSKELNEWIKRKESVALIKKEPKLTKEEEESLNKFNELIGTERK